jgi:hypothetical protein
MTARLSTLLMVSASVGACGGERSPIDAGAPGDASSELGNDASGEADSGKLPGESTPCPIWNECPPEAPFCCNDSGANEIGSCYPDWPNWPWDPRPQNAHSCHPDPAPVDLVGSDCYDYTVALHHPERCPDGFPFCCVILRSVERTECQELEGNCLSLCASRDVAGWRCEQ